MRLIEMADTIFIDLTDIDQHHIVDIADTLNKGRGRDVADIVVAPDNAGMDALQRRLCGLSIAHSGRDGCKKGEPSPDYHPKRHSSRKALPHFNALGCLKKL